MDPRFDALDGVSERKACPQCGKKRLFFCYDCCVYIEGVRELCPTIELPMRVEIIKHPAEKNGKSTAIHCKLLAPAETRLFAPDDSQIPDFAAEADRRNTVLVFPDASATSMREFRRASGRPIDRLVFLDATWPNVNKLRALPQLKNVPKVSLNAYKTEYWREQIGYSDECLATIEAILYALKEAHAANQEAEGADGDEPNDRLDDLLFWFRFFKQKFIDGGRAD
ncbi:TRNA-uridine aminocarboxypropyltransferase [Aphelenchoides fujianensis]|nr:TRNA-uridine aminocarboxypropyltransferase [Aphelenchoides fujianensis]